MNDWLIEQQRGTTRELHDAAQRRLRAGATDGHRRATVQQATDRALVLGSAEPLGHADLDSCAAAGVDVVRRRSGGGAVLVEPTSLVWVDLFVPAGDPLWWADVGKAAWWVGEAWRDALGSAGFAGLEVWKGPLQRRRWSDRVCFAGLGAGEVVFAGSGAKVVGVSQRRTRGGALFQSACLVRWGPAALLGLLAMTDAERAVANAELPAVAAGVGPALAGKVLAGLLAALP